MYTSYRKLLDYSPDVICAIDREGRLIQISAAAKDVWGYDPSELKGKCYIDLVVEEDRPVTLEIAERIIDGLAVRNFQNHYRCKDGSVKPILWSARWVDEEQLMFCIGREDVAKINITSREASEEIKRLSLIAEETVNVVILYDAEGKVSWVNKAFTRVTGYAPEEVLGKKAGTVLKGPDVRQVTLSYLEKCMRAGHSFNYEIASYNRSGQVFWLDVKGKPVLDEHGKVLYYFSIANDITVKKEIEQSLKLSEERYKTLFYKSPTPKWICNMDTLQFMEVNEAAMNLYGYTKSEFLQLSLYDLVTIKNRHTVEELRRQLSGQELVHCCDKVQHQKKGGDAVWVEMFAHRIELSTGAQAFFMIYDLTERTQWEKRLGDQQVRYQNDLAQVVLTTQEKERSDIGKELHDNINQILASAKLYVEYSRYYPHKSDELLIKGVDLIQRSIQEIRRLSKALVTPSFGEGMLQDILIDMFQSYTELGQFQVDWSFDFSESEIPPDLQLTVYRILQEAFTNTLRYAKASQVKICIAQGDQNLVIDYRDNGKGFVLGSTKKGLGLYNIKSRAEALHGTVSINTAPDKGFHVEVSFPL